MRAAPPTPKRRPGASGSSLRELGSPGEMLGRRPGRESRPSGGTASASAPSVEPGPGLPVDVAGADEGDEVAAPGLAGRAPEELRRHHPADSRPERAGARFISA